MRQVTQTSGGLLRTLQQHYLIAQVKSGVPGDSNSVLDALVRRAAAGMGLECALGRLAKLGRHGKIIMDCDGFDANGFANAGNSAIDGGGVGLAVKGDLAP